MAPEEVANRSLKGGSVHCLRYLRCHAAIAETQCSVSRFAVDEVVGSTGTEYS